MKQVKGIFTSPIKSMALDSVRTVYVSDRGIEQDRRFHIVDAQHQLLTQRQIGPLVRIRVEYNLSPETLVLQFPDGSRVDGPLELGDPIVTRMWNRRVPGYILGMRWNKHLSKFCGRPVRLVRTDNPFQSYDKYPISLISQASLDELNRRQIGQVTADSRRFRPNIVLNGCEPHEEDSWVGSSIQVGKQLILKIMSLDPRCVITTHDPDTGKRDLDTLRIIMGYRPDPEAAYFGVYGVVETSGTIGLGDNVTVRRVAESVVN